MHDTLSIRGVYAQSKPIGVIAGTKACCLLVLKKSNQPQGRHFALFRETVHDTLSISGVYAQSKTTGVIVGTKACCVLVLQNSSQPQGRHYVLFRKTVHDTLSIRDVYAQSKLIGVIAGTKHAVFWCCRKAVIHRAGTLLSSGKQCMTL